MNKLITFLLILGVTLMVWIVYLVQELLTAVQCANVPLDEITAQCMGYLK